MHLLSAIATLLPLITQGFASVTTARQPHFNWHETRYVYAFGDSYTYIQGTEGRTNFSFIGDAFNFSFTPRELLSNEIVPKFTSSDGSNWIEFLTGCMSGRPSRCRRQLWNFAFAGADIDSNLLPLHHDYTIPLTDEVKQWATYAADILPRPARETLTAWWIGINDTGDSFGNTTITDRDAFWDAEMDSYFGAVEKAYSRGLRGTYLFINVPPGHRAPARVNDPTGQALLKQNINQYNSKLAKRVQQFRAKHQDMTVLTFDSYTWFNGVLDNASRYGFKNTTGFCQCKDPSFFWFNSGHPTEHVHKLLAQAIEAQLLKASHH
ncbi:hypothetical protein BXZ70DRAFT_1005195 [Cristinia sonorae]|uniref:Carbohydrate esterase family 16 protein n=1 Tax=Cristinia sonorae TaxID=1940300 RepID=A0A8K0XSW2_9AGAR|nr:hypothetical protein BXZ70DRAFT_1005195 [Cristinia sonorae]